MEYKEKECCPLFMYIIEWNPWLFESTKTKLHSGCIMYINAEALHGGFTWECCFYILFRNYILFHQAALSLHYCCTHCNSCSGLSGIWQLMVRRLPFGGFSVCHHPVHPNPDLVAEVPCRQMGWLQPVTHITSLWGMGEALLPWTSLFILWDGET